MSKKAYTQVTHDVDDRICAYLLFGKLVHMRIYEWKLILELIAELEDGRS